MKNHHMVLAAQFEREGKLSKAAGYWRKAQLNPDLCEANREYAKRRQAYCEQWAGRI